MRPDKGLNVGLVGCHNRGDGDAGPADAGDVVLGLFKGEDEVNGEAGDRGVDIGEPERRKAGGVIKEHGDVV